LSSTGKRPAISASIRELKISRVGHSLGPEANWFGVCGRVVFGLFVFAEWSKKLLEA
jgi:hypothetical protein